MTKQIRLNAFDMNCAVHQSQGLWRHPRDHSTAYKSMAYWLDLARTLERGLFDGIFLADVAGIYDVYGASPDAALRNGVQVPVNDPFMVVPAMAAVTEHLGFGVTGNLSYEPPYVFARRLTTLDHLTSGRFGWNIVTGYLNSAAKATGLAKQTAHDTRYDIAAEYMDLMYKLWESSWEDDAVRADKTRGVYVDPAKVHRIRHDGEYFRLDAVYLAEPSPQRTPVLYQAGTSPKGIAFAGRHAECVFIAPGSKKSAKTMVDAIRHAAVESGRRPDDVLIFGMMTVIVAKSDAEAADLLAEYRSYASHEGALVLLGGWSGVDFSTCDPDEPVRYVKNDAVQTLLAGATRSDPSRTVSQAAAYLAVGGAGPLIVGSPGTVAGEMQAWIEETGMDGFNLTYTVAPESIRAIVDLVVPELQSRGIYKTGYAPGTLREKLFGGSPRLQLPHYGAAFRGRYRESG
jgi:alkanesulfonate monooxygenase